MRDREHKKAWARQNYLKHKDNILFRQKQNRATRDWYKNLAYERKMLAAARHRARKKGLEFTLVLEDIIIPEYCPVLGYKLVYKAGKGCGSAPNSPSLDRLDSSKGYTKENVRVISARANLVKNNSTLEELKALVRYMENGFTGRENGTFQENQK